MTNREMFDELQLQLRAAARACIQFAGEPYINEEYLRGYCRASIEMYRWVIGMDYSKALEFWNHLVEDECAAMVSVGYLNAERAEKKAAQVRATP